jgi:hypothetical protein
MDIERTMQFILEHQAAHAAAIAQHDEELKELRVESREQQKLLRQTQDLLHETVKTLGVLGESAIGAIDRLARAQEEAHGRLNDLQDDVSVLLKIVDGLVRRRDEGKASNGPDTPAV